MQEIICQYILQWVEDNIFTGRNISDLSKATGYSRKTLESWFVMFCGMSPGNYLFRRRMTRAAVMLRLTVLPITEIAQELHHSCNQNFARAFRRFSGTTPTEYRNRNSWDLTTLQNSLLFSDENVTEVAICELPDRYLCGIQHYFSDSYFSHVRLTFIQQIQHEVTRLILSGENDIYFSGRPVVSDKVNRSREGHLSILMAIGQLTGAETDNSILMPGGRFCSYRFTCKWSEYSLYANMCFLKLMSENKFHFSGGDCYVHFTGNPKTIMEQVECETFIPIS